MAFMDFWITDGTTNGTHELLAEPAGATAAKDPLGLNPNDLTVFNGEVFFNGFDKFGRQQLWETDGTAAGTQMLTVAGASTASGLTPSNLEVYDGQLLFQGINNKGYVGLWTTDGTPGGTQEISPSSGTYLGGLNPADLTALRPGSSPSTVTSSILFQNTSTGQASIWDMNGSTLVGGGAVSPNPGPSWTEIGTGDFNNDGHSDILWQNANTGQASIWDMNGNTLHRRRDREPQSRTDLARDRNRRFRWRRPFRHPVAEHQHRPGLDLGNGREHPASAAAPSAPIRGLPGKRSERAISTRTAMSDILWQNTNTGQVSIWEMNGNNLTAADR